MPFAGLSVIVLENNITIQNIVRKSVRWESSLFHAQSDGQTDRTEVDKSCFSQIFPNAATNPLKK